MKTTISLLRSSLFGYFAIGFLAGGLGAAFSNDVLYQSLVGVVL
jgi:hypothetical protein